MSTSVQSAAVTAPSLIPIDGDHDDKRLSKFFKKHAAELTALHLTPASFKRLATETDNKQVVARLHKLLEDFIKANDPTGKGALTGPMQQAVALARDLIAHHDKHLKRLVHECNEKSERGAVDGPTISAPHRLRTSEGAPQGVSPAVQSVAKANTAGVQ